MDLLVVLQPFLQLNHLNFRFDVVPLTVIEMLLGFKNFDILVHISIDLVRQRHKNVVFQITIF